MTKFSVITPSFRSGNWLKLCIPSVADQGVEVEHIVQDGGSDDGTLAWLPQDRRVKAFVEKDQGMYDAINRGYRRAKGEILSYLNCDEQYLPGALKAVGEFFDKHPEIDVVFADAVVVDNEGRFLCQRGVVLPTKCHSMVSFNLAILTCSTFIRRRVIQEHQIFFDTQYRVIGDAYWILSLLEKRIPMAVMRQRTTIFTDTGSNLCLHPKGVKEQQELCAKAPAWAQKLRPCFIIQYRLRKLLAGLYFSKPFTYEIYTRQSPEKRVQFTVANPQATWKRQSDKSEQI